MKKQTIKKNIYAVLAAGALIQVLPTVEAYAANLTQGGDLYSDSLQSGVMSEGADSSFERISKDRMQELISLNPSKNEAYYLSSESIAMDLEDRTKLQLISRESKKAVEGVQWFCRTNYPYNTIYDAGEKMPEGTVISLDKDANIHALCAKYGYVNEADVWAYYNGHIYKCEIKVLSPEESKQRERDIELDKMADEIVSDMRDLTDIEKVKAAHDWVAENVKYVKRDGDYTAYAGIVEKRAVCSGYSRAYEYLLNKLGIENLIMTGTLYHNNVAHMWNLVKLDGEWYHVDTTWDASSFEGKVRYTYFLLNDSDVERDRSIFYNPQAGNMGKKYRYYVYEEAGLFADSVEDIKAVIEKQYSEMDEGSEYMEISFLTTSYYTKEFLDSKVKEVTGENALYASLRDYRGKSLYECRVKVKNTDYIKESEPPRYKEEQDTPEKESEPEIKIPEQEEMPEKSEQGDMLQDISKTQEMPEVPDESQETDAVEQNENSSVLSNTGSSDSESIQPDLEKKLSEESFKAEETESKVSENKAESIVSSQEDLYIAGESSSAGSSSHSQGSSSDAGSSSGGGSFGGGSSRSRGGSSGGGSSRRGSSSGGGAGSRSGSTVTAGVNKASAGNTAASGVWKADEKGWWYTLADGSYVKEAWRNVNGADGSHWYYFGRDGYMATGWISLEGKWYYLDKSQGRMYQNEKTPDGYTVGADGAWIQ